MFKSFLNTNSAHFRPGLLEIIGKVDSDGVDKEVKKKPGKRPSAASKKGAAKKKARNSGGKKSKEPEDDDDNNEEEAEEDALDEASCSQSYRIRRVTIVLCTCPPAVRMRRKSILRTDSLSLALHACAAGNDRFCHGVIVDSLSVESELSVASSSG